MGKDDKFGSIDGGMGGMTKKPPKLPQKPANSPNYTYRSKPSKNGKVKPVHNPELFNKVLKENEDTKERASVLVDPDLLGRIAIVIVVFLMYMIFFR